MGNKGKKTSKSDDPDDAKSVSLDRGDLVLTIGTKLEAMDYMGVWLSAKVIDIKVDKGVVLVHFDGWAPKFDVWLAYDCDRIRPGKPKLKTPEWRVGARVLAKWGPAGTTYPAMVSKIKDADRVEVRFYDGFKKVLKNSSIQPDTEKLYRQYGASTALKDVFTPDRLSRSSSVDSTCSNREKKSNYSSEGTHVSINKTTDKKLHLKTDYGTVVADTNKVGQSYESQTSASASASSSSLSSPLTTPSFPSSPQSIDVSEGDSIYDCHKSIGNASESLTKSLASTSEHAEHLKSVTLNCVKALSDLKKTSTSKAPIKAILDTEIKVDSPKSVLPKLKLKLVDSPSKVEDTSAAISLSTTLVDDGLPSSSGAKTYSNYVVCPAFSSTDDSDDSITPTGVSVSSSAIPSIKTTMSTIKGLCKGQNVDKTKPTLRSAREKNMEKPTHHDIIRDFELSETKRISFGSTGVDSSSKECNSAAKTSSDIPIQRRSSRICGSKQDGEAQLASLSKPVASSHSGSDPGLGGKLARNSKPESNAKLDKAIAVHGTRNRLRESPRCLTPKSESSTIATVVKTIDDKNTPESPHFKGLVKADISAVCSPGDSEEDVPLLSLATRKNNTADPRRRKSSRIKPDETDNTKASTILEPKHPTSERSGSKNTFWKSQQNSKLAPPYSNLSSKTGKKPLLPAQSSERKANSESHRRNLNFELDDKPGMESPTLDSDISSDTDRPTHESCRRSSRSKTCVNYDEDSLFVDACCTALTGSAHIASTSKFNTSTISINSQVAGGYCFTRTSFLTTAVSATIPSTTSTITTTMHKSQVVSTNQANSRKQSKTTGAVRPGISDDSSLRRSSRGRSELDELSSLPQAGPKKRQTVSSTPTKLFTETIATYEMLGGELVSKTEHEALMLGSVVRGASSSKSDIIENVEVSVPETLIIKIPLIIRSVPLQLKTLKGDSIIESMVDSMVRCIEVHEQHSKDTDSMRSEDVCRATMVSYILTEMVTKVASGTCVKMKTGSSLPSVEDHIAAVDDPAETHSLSPIYENADLIPKGKPTLVELMGNAVVLDRGVNTELKSKEMREKCEVCPGTKNSSPEMEIQPLVGATSVELMKVFGNTVMAGIKKLEVNLQGSSVEPLESPNQSLITKHTSEIVLEEKPKTLLGRQGHSLKTVSHVDSEMGGEVVKLVMLSPGIETSLIEEVGEPSLVSSADVQIGSEENEELASGVTDLETGNVHDESKEGITEEIDLTVAMIVTSIIESISTQEDRYSKVEEKNPSNSSLESSCLGEVPDVKTLEMDTPSRDDISTSGDLEGKKGVAMESHAVDRQIESHLVQCTQMEMELETRLLPIYSSYDLANDMRKEDEIAASVNEPNEPSFVCNVSEDAKLQLEAALITERPSIRRGAKVDEHYPSIKLSSTEVDVSSQVDTAYQVMETLTQKPVFSCNSSSAELQEKIDSVELDDAQGNINASDAFVLLSLNESKRVAQIACPNISESTLTRRSSRVQQRDGSTVPSETKSCETVHNTRSHRHNLSGIPGKSANMSRASTLGNDVSSHQKANISKISSSSTSEPKGRITASNTRYQQQEHVVYDPENHGGKCSKTVKVSDLTVKENSDLRRSNRMKELPKSSPTVSPKSVNTSSLLEQNNSQSSSNIGKSKTHNQLLQKSSNDGAKTNQTEHKIASDEELKLSINDSKENLSEDSKVRRSNRIKASPKASPIVSPTGNGLLRGSYSKYIDDVVQSGVGTSSGVDETKKYDSDGCLWIPGNLEETVGKEDDQSVSGDMQVRRSNRVKASSKVSTPVIPQGSDDDVSGTGKATLDCKQSTPLFLDRQAKQERSRNVSFSEDILTIQCNFEEPVKKKDDQNGPGLEVRRSSRINSSPNASPDELDEDERVTSSGILKAGCITQSFSLADTEVLYQNETTNLASDLEEVDQIDTCGNSADNNVSQVHSNFEESLANRDDQSWTEDLKVRRSSRIKASPKASPLQSASAKQDTNSGALNLGSNLKISNFQNDYVYQSDCVKSNNVAESATFSDVLGVQCNFDEPEKNKEEQTVLEDLNVRRSKRIKPSPKASPMISSVGNVGDSIAAPVSETQYLSPGGGKLLRNEKTTSKTSIQKRVLQTDEVELSTPLSIPSVIREPGSSDNEQNSFPDIRRSSRIKASPKESPMVSPKGSNDGTYTVLKPSAGHPHSEGVLKPYKSKADLDNGNSLNIAESSKLTQDSSLVDSEIRRSNRIKASPKLSPVVSPKGGRSADLKNLDGSTHTMNTRASRENKVQTVSPSEKRESGRVRQVKETSATDGKQYSGTDKLFVGQRLHDGPKWKKVPFADEGIPGTIRRSNRGKLEPQDMSESIDVDNKGKSHSTRSHTRNSDQITTKEGDKATSTKSPRTSRANSHSKDPVTEQPQRISNKSTHLAEAESEEFFLDAIPASVDILSFNPVIGESVLDKPIALSAVSDNISDNLRESSIDTSYIGERDPGNHPLNLYKPREKNPDFSSGNTDIAKALTNVSTSSQLLRSPDPSTATKIDPFVSVRELEESTELIQTRCDSTVIFSMNLNTEERDLPDEMDPNLPYIQESGVYAECETDLKSPELIKTRNDSTVVMTMQPDMGESSNDGDLDDTVVDDELLETAQSTGFDSELVKTRNDSTIVMTMKPDMCESSNDGDLDEVVTDNDNFASGKSTDFTSELVVEKRNESTVVMTIRPDMDDLSDDGDLDEVVICNENPKTVKSVDFTSELVVKKRNDSTVVMTIKPDMCESSNDADPDEVVMESDRVELEKSSDFTAELVKSRDDSTVVMTIEPDMGESSDDNKEGPDMQKTGKLVEKTVELTPELVKTRNDSTVVMTMRPDMDESSDDADFDQGVIESKPLKDSVTSPNITSKLIRTRNDSTVILTMKPDSSDSCDDTDIDPGPADDFVKDHEKPNSSTPKLIRTRSNPSTVVISIKPDIEETDDPMNLKCPIDVGEPEKPHDRVRNYIQHMLEDYDQVQDFITDDKIGGDSSKSLVPNEKLEVSLFSVQDGGESDKLTGSSPDLVRTQFDSTVPVEVVDLSEKLPEIEAFHNVELHPENDKADTVALGANNETLYKKKGRNSSDKVCDNIVDNHLGNSSSELIRNCNSTVMSMATSLENSLDGMELNTSASKDDVGSQLHELDYNDATVPYDELFQDLMVDQDIVNDQVYKPELNVATNNEDARDTRGRFSHKGRKSLGRMDDNLSTVENIPTVGKRTLRKRNKPAVLTQTDAAKNDHSKDSKNKGILGSFDDRNATDTDILQSQDPPLEVESQTIGDIEDGRNRELENSDMPVPESTEVPHTSLGARADSKKIAVHQEKGVEEDEDSDDPLNSSELIRTRRGSSIIISIKPNMEEKEEHSDKAYPGTCVESGTDAETEKINVVTASEFKVGALVQDTTKQGCTASDTTEKFLSEIDDQKDIPPCEKSGKRLIDEEILPERISVASSSKEEKAKSKTNEEMTKNSKSKSKQGSKAPKQRNRYEAYYKIVPAPYVNVFEDVVPDLNSGRPVRRNKLKPARYSTDEKKEESKDRKSKKDVKDVPKVNENRTSQSSTRSRRDSSVVAADDRPTRSRKESKDTHKESPGEKVLLTSRLRRDSKECHVSQATDKKEEDPKPDVKDVEVRETVLVDVEIDAKPEIEEVTKNLDIDITKEEEAPIKEEIPSPDDSTAEIKAMNQSGSEQDADKDSESYQVDDVEEEPEEEDNEKYESMGTRRTRSDRAIPIKGSKIVKPKAALQTVTGRKVVSKKFEEKYEMFKKKWKEEKEKRRKMQSEDIVIGEKVPTEKNRKQKRNEEKYEVDSTEAVDEVVPEVNEIEEKREVDDVKSIEEKREVEDVKSIEEKREVDDVRSIEEIREIDDVKSIEAIREVEEVKELEEIAVQEVKEKEEVREVTEVKEKEEIEGFEETKDVEEDAGELKEVEHKELKEKGEVSDTARNLDIEKTLEEQSQDKNLLFMDETSKNNEEPFCEGEHPDSENRLIESASMDNPVSTSTPAKDIDITDDELLKEKGPCIHVSLRDVSSLKEATDTSVDDQLEATEEVSEDKLPETEDNENRSVKKKSIKNSKGCQRRKRRKAEEDEDYVPPPEEAHLLTANISRTPIETISTASMVEEERPSQKQQRKTRNSNSFKSPKKPQRSPYNFQRSPIKLRKSPAKVPVSPDKLQKSPGKFQHSPEKHPYPFYVPNFTHPPFLYAPTQNSSPSATQIAANRIQRRVHQKKLFQQQKKEVTSDPICIDFDEASNKREEKLNAIRSISVNSNRSDRSESSNEIDITDIVLNKQKETSGENQNTSAKPVVKKRKSLDFITGTLKNKQELEQQKIDQLRDSKNKLDEKIPKESVHLSSPQLEERPVVSPRQFNSPTGPAGSDGEPSNLPFPTVPLVNGSTCFPVIQPPEASSGHVQPNTVTRVDVPIPRPYPLQRNPMLSPPPNTMLLDETIPYLTCTPSPAQAARPSNLVPSPLGNEVAALGLPSLQPSVFQSVSTGISSEISANIGDSDIQADKHKLEEGMETDAHISDQCSPQPELSPISEQVTQSAPDPVVESVGVVGVEIDKIGGIGAEVANDDVEGSDAGGKKPLVRKGEKRIRSPHDEPNMAQKRTRADSAVTSLSRPESPLDEYKCFVPDCGKTFRKSNLLEYHKKYFHSAKPVAKQKRSRASSLVSSAETSPSSPVVGVDTSPKVVINSLAMEEPKVQNTASPSQVEDCSTEQSDSAPSDTDSESEEEFQSVDDCVKCACEDECELGFMIQCEQCFTWQHGECVGYSQPKAVPLFYLCHVCSKPKGLRKSAQYSNDYTWYRHGLLPPIRQDAPDDKLEEIDNSRHYDVENEEILSSIMMTTHSMMSDLYNVRDVLQGIRNKFILLKDSKNPELLDFRADNNEEMLHLISEEARQSRNAEGRAIGGKESASNKSGNITEKFDKDFTDILFSINNRTNEQRSNVGKSDTETLYESNCRNSSVEGYISENLKGASIALEVNSVLDNVVEMVARLAEEGSSHHYLLPSSGAPTNTINDDSSTYQSQEKCLMLPANLMLRSPAHELNSVNDVGSADIDNHRLVVSEHNNASSDETRDILQGMIESVCNTEALDKMISRSHLEGNVSVGGSHAVSEEGTDLLHTRLRDEALGRETKLSIETEGMETREEDNVFPNNNNNGEREKAETSDIELANLSEDSIPYMETDEEFYPKATREGEGGHYSASIPPTTSVKESHKGEDFQLNICDGLEIILQDTEDWNNSSPESLVARYNVLVEVERIEDEINERLEDMHAKLDELEAEYDSIDKSREILKEFKSKFNVPDLNSLMAQLNKVKWQGIIKSHQDSESG